MKSNIYVFCVHRGGSCVLGDIVESVCENIIPYRCINEEIELHRESTHHPSWDLGGCFAPIRKLEFFPTEILKPSDNIIINIRDPRDTISSGYYGFNLLHTDGLKNEEHKKRFDEGIDEWYYTIKDSVYKVYMDYLITLKKFPNVKILKYEMMISDFKYWLNEFTEVFNIDNEHKEFVYDKFKNQFNVEKEDIFSHKRQVKAGDYKNKFNPDTINRMNTEFKYILRSFGYD